MINRAARKKKYIVKLRENGNKAEARRYAGVVASSTIARWQSEDTRFAAMCEQAAEDARDDIDLEIRRRGMHGTDELIVTPKGVAVDKDGKPYTQKRYSDTLLALHAKAHLRHLYGDRQAVELTGRNGGAIEMESPLERIATRLLALKAAQTIEGTVDSELDRIPAPARADDDPYGVADL